MSSYVQKTISFDKSSKLLCITEWHVNITNYRHFSVLFKFLVSQRVVFNVLNTYNFGVSYQTSWRLYSTCMAYVQEDSGWLKGFQAEPVGDSFCAQAVYLFNSCSFNGLISMLTWHLTFDCLFFKRMQPAARWLSSVWHKKLSAKGETACLALCTGNNICQTNTKLTHWLCWSLP